jgi:hypothetical protein
LAAKDGERERVVGLYRKGHITCAEAESELDRTAAEAKELRVLLAGLDAQAALVVATEVQVLEVDALLGSLRDEIALIEETDDWTRKRQIVELLVRQITVWTTGTGRGKSAELLVSYHFGS